jgi:hypothetical protein
MVADRERPCRCRGGRCSRARDPASHSARSGPSARVFDCGAGRVGSRGERPETPLNLLRGVIHPPLGWLSCRRSEDRCHTQGGTRLAAETSIRIEWRRRSESWNHWAHYRRPGHYHFGDCDPATDLTRPGCEEIRLAEVPLVRVLLPVDVDRLNAAGAATGDKWDAPVPLLCMHVPPSRLAPRHPFSTSRTNIATGGMEKASPGGPATPSVRRR